MSIIRYITESDLFVFENRTNFSGKFYRKSFDKIKVKNFIEKLEKFLTGNNEFNKNGEYLIFCENDDEISSFFIGFVDGNCYIECNARFPTMNHGDGNIHLLDVFDNQIMLNDLKNVILPILEKN